MRVFLRPLWFVALLAHAVGATLWWGLMPGGFPLDHPRFWINRFLPALIIALVASALLGAVARKLVPMRVVLVSLAAMWLAAAVAAPITFPSSGWYLGVAMLLFGGATAGAAAAVRLTSPHHAAWTWGAIAAGTLLGGGMPWTQRGADPSTAPLNETAGRAIARSEHRTTMVDVAPGIQVQTAEGIVTVRKNGYSGFVEPMLTFASVSPDRCWSLLAPNPIIRRPRHRYAGFERDGEELRIAFADAEGPAWLRLLPGAGAGEDGGDSVHIDAGVRLLSPIYSHLNSFCVVSMIGHRRARVVFSPCPDTPIDVSFADYPVGRPVRGAYFDETGAFRIVEARTGEKGPYRTLATGTLRRGEPVTVTFLDGERAVMRVTLRDWSAQASRELSPTAGWGVTQNAIEFGLEDDYATAPATVFFSLAGTSLGRGWDTVGHAAGTYRNRVELEMLE